MEVVTQYNEGQITTSFHGPVILMEPRRKKVKKSEEIKENKDLIE